jgi:hypothetical protein
MKTQMHLLLIALIYACALIFSSCETEILSNTAHEPLQTTELSVAGMRCTSCSNAIMEELLSREKDIKYVHIDPSKEPPAINTVVKHKVNIKKDYIKKIIEDSGFSIDH